MQKLALRAFLVWLLLMFIACGPPTPEGARAPSGGPTTNVDAKPGSKTGPDDKAAGGDDASLAPAAKGAMNADGEGAADQGGFGDAAAAPPPAARARGLDGSMGAPGGAVGGTIGGVGGGTIGAAGGAEIRPTIAFNEKDPVPVSAADPSLGKRTALVTLVVFSDFQCPFCKKAAFTVAEIRAAYGDSLRVVWKNNPLAFHKFARPAAETAMMAFATGGNDAFWAYHDRVFSSQQDEASFDFAFTKSGLTQQDIERKRGGAARKVDLDMELGKGIGVTGTPAFFINGVMLRGAQPPEKFREIIDAEIAKAKEMIAAGVALDALYASAAAKNFVKPAAREESKPLPPPDDKTVHRVPVGSSPVRGKATAPVTIVEFADFECPFCQRAAKTIKQVTEKYGDKVRVVFKHAPLPFHPRAEPAAQFAIEARAQQGDAGFWKAADMLFDAGRNLGDSDLEAMASALGLRTKPVMAAIGSHKYQSVIDDDLNLADDVEATGTPHFFINGRRLVGAQPLERFTAIVDEEIAKAQALIAKGTPAAKIYDALQKDAAPPPPLEKKAVPAPGRESPSMGAATAKVVVQVFSDFQCPFCKRAEPTIAELLKVYPNKIRIVWRNLPLPMHPQAQIAAEAALEAKAQKGDAAFWKMHDRLFEDQTAAGLSRAALVDHGAAIGLDVKKLEAALDSGTHKQAIASDKALAELAGISGTPGFVINGYFISGSQSLRKFRKVVDRALAEAK